MIFRSNASEFSGVLIHMYTKVYPISPRISFSSANVYLDIYLSLYMSNIILSTLKFEKYAHINSLFFLDSFMILNTKKANTRFVPI